MSYDLSSMTVVDVSGLQSLNMVGVMPADYARRGVLFHATACPSVGGSSLQYLLHDHTPISSADQLIARDGTIHQLVPPGYFAYHSGPARWEGYRDEEGGLNMAYYGVEIENTNDGREPYTREQVVSAAATYAYKCALHRWPTDRRVCKHYEVALPLGRKTDPYMFPWGEFWKVVWDIRADWPAERFGIPVWVPPGR